VSDGIILQLAVGRAHEALLDLSEPRARAWAQRWGLDYRTQRCRLCADRHFYWDKIALIQCALQVRSYRYLVYLDADTVVERLDVDPRSAVALPAAPIGMVRHAAPIGGMQIVHRNAGAIYVRVCPQVPAFFDAVWNDADCFDPFGWHDQAAINDVASRPEFDGLVGVLPDRWNSTYRTNEAPDAVVSAWHGASLDDRLRLMCGAVARLRLSEEAAPAA
jgi:hypothetical protein